MFYVYVIQSEKSGQYYVGHTRDFDRRIEEHNRGKTPSTRGRGPFKLIYKELQPERLLAIRRERELKRAKSGNTFQKLFGKLQDPIA